MDICSLPAELTSEAFQMAAMVDPQRNGPLAIRRPEPIRENGYPLERVFTR